MELTLFFNHNELHLSGWYVLDPCWIRSCQHERSAGNEAYFPRKDHATVLWTNNDITGVAFIGGSFYGSHHYSTHDSAGVFFSFKFFDVDSDHKWQKGPALNVARVQTGAALCNGYVYAVGGYGLDTIERIPVAQLFDADRNNSWTVLPACLSEPRSGCAAVTVHDRYIVVMGGRNHNGALSSVDVIDTMKQAATNANNNPHTDIHYSLVTVSAGPSMRAPRHNPGATVLDGRIWVVGGYEGTVEYLQYESVQNNNGISQSIFASDWRMRQDLSLPTGLDRNSVALLGQCVIVTGAAPNSSCQLSVHLLDPQRGVVVQMPDLCGTVNDCTIKMGVHNNVFLAIVSGGIFPVSYMESFLCVNLSLSHLKKFSGEVDSGQQSLITCFGRYLSEKRPKCASQVQLRCSLVRRVERLCHSLVYFYLFHKGGSVTCYNNKKCNNNASVPSKAKTFDMC